MVNVLFSRPEFLWLLLALPLLVIAHFLFLKRTQTKAMHFANFEAIKRIAGQRYVTKNITVLILRILILVCLVVGLTGMTFYYEGVKNDFNYVIALDTSASMLATDFEPTRLEAAKSASTLFLNSLRSNAQIGIVEFSGVNYVNTMFTDDKLSLRLALQNINVSRISGTDISGAIVTATNMLLTLPESEGRAILLITDGVDTVGAYIDNNVDMAAKYAYEHQVVIHSVGLGSENAALGYLPSSFNLTASFDSSSLALLANTTSGSFILPRSVNELDEYFTTLDMRNNIGPIALRLDWYGFLLVFILLCVEWIGINLAFRRVA